MRWFCEDLIKKGLKNQASTMQVHWPSMADPALVMIKIINAENKLTARFFEVVRHDAADGTVVAGRFL